MNETKYTKNGEWIRFHEGAWRLGYCQSTADELGDLTFVQLPEVGKVVVAGEVLCSIEAVKAAADFYTPVSGRVSSVNRQLEAQPQLVNSSPELEGWICTLVEVPRSEIETLMGAEEWQAWELGR